MLPHSTSIHLHASTARLQTSETLHQETHESNPASNHPQEHPNLFFYSISISLPSSTLPHTHTLFSLAPVNIPPRPIPPPSLNLRISFLSIFYHRNLILSLSGTSYSIPLLCPLYTNHQSSFNPLFFSFLPYIKIFLLHALVKLPRIYFSSSYRFILRSLTHTYPSIHSIHLASFVSLLPFMVWLNLHS